jgi:hypothetical protein
LQSGKKSVRTLPAIIATFTLLSGVQASGSPKDDASIHVAALRPGAFVLTAKDAIGATLVDVANVQSAADGTATTHVYFVSKDGRPFAGKVSIFEDYLVQYDCKSGWLILEGGTLADDKLNWVGVVTNPASVTPWVAALKPKIADIYGFTEVCTADHSRPRMGNGKAWTTVASTVLAELRAP